MNFIESKIETTLTRTQLQSFKSIYRIEKKSKVKYWLLAILLVATIVLLLPWTQNIMAKGTITTLRQEQRPQQLNTIIPGKVVKWHVKEGDVVKAGDTIMQLAEIKDDYLDPNLLGRTKDQLNAKQITIESYKCKVGTTNNQITALMQGSNFKIAQIENKIRQQRMKVQSDSAELNAIKNDVTIATAQFKRQKNMYDSGLVSLTQLEQRNIAYQNALAKKTSAEIKFLNAKQELNVLQLEQNGTVQDYNEKIAKASGDKFQALSQIATGEGEVAKLQNQYMNYGIRSKLYYITAPQSGQIVKAKKAGIGEVVKEGEMIVEIVPETEQHAVEIFVRPVDQPLIAAGQKVRLMFDGFPAIVFSGWPQSSYGTFGGTVIAIENSISDNGQFRVIISEDIADRNWPKQLKIGAGAQGFALLKNVPIWYELWRNINGFPPEYYKVDKKQSAKEK